MGCFFSRDYEDDVIEYDMSPIRHLPVIFVNGVPGAGNQTVAQTISNITGYTMIRPGELVRTESEKDTPRGRFIADILKALEDVPEQLTVDLIKEAMLRNQDAKGFILVGFPRNPRMSNIFNRQVKRPEKIVALEVDNEVAAERLQTKLSELGRPACEINSARQVVKQAAHNMKSIQKRFRGHVITVDSTGNPSALSNVLKEMLKDSMEKRYSSEQKCPMKDLSKERSLSEVCLRSKEPSLSREPSLPKELPLSKEPPLSKEQPPLPDEAGETPQSPIFRLPSPTKDFSKLQHEEIVAAE